MKKYLRTAWTHIRRSPYQAMGAVAVLTLTFFVASTTVLVAAGSQEILRYFEAKPQVTAFFKDNVTLDQVDVLKAKLAETGKVKETHYVSKEEALKIYREQNKNDPLLLEMVTANILPASLEVSTTDLSYLQEIAKILRRQPGVEEVVFQEDIVTALKNWTTTLRKVGLALGGFSALISIFIILIIVGLKVSAKKREIEILRLIGATRGYIKIPFIFEGIFYGISGAFLAWGVVYLALLYATPWLVKFFAGMIPLPVPLTFMLAVLAGELAAGVMIGSLGGLLAVKRYFK